MAESRKIGEGRVDLTANAQPLEAGLESAKRSTENWSQSVTGAARNVGAAIATAYAAFRVGNQIGDVVRDIREANIKIQDFRNSLGEGSASFFSETQAQKISLRLERLKLQAAAIGNAFGASDMLASVNFQAAAAKLREETRRATQETIDKGESERNRARQNLFLYGETINRLMGGQSESEVHAETLRNINQINEAYKSRLEFLREQESIQRAINANEAAAALLARQEAQRAGFSLADQVLAESVVNRELGRIYDITPPAQGRY